MRTENHSSTQLLTLIEAEARTRRKVSTWRKDIRERRIPYVKLGRQYRIPGEFIDQMIARGWHEPVVGSN
jgi:excisionase family DNA binding protein